MRSSKKVILDLIISEIQKGNSPAKISKKHNIKKTTLQYYLRQLKKEGIIEKVAYGTWEVKKKFKSSPKATTPQHKQIRGHAFNWKVKFDRDYDWVKHLKKNNISFQLIGAMKSTPRILFDDKKIWLTKTGLIIYEPKSFFSKSSHTSKGMAVYELDKTIKLLSKALKMRLGAYSFKTSREHYGMIKNELARQYNERGDKMIIRDDRGDGWLWIDDSLSLGELETNEPFVSKQLQDWWNDAKANRFDMKMSDVKNVMFQMDQRIKTLEKSEIKVDSPIPDYIN